MGSGFLFMECGMQTLPRQNKKSIYIFSGKFTLLLLSLEILVKFKQNNNLRSK